MAVVSCLRPSCDGYAFGLGKGWGGGGGARDLMYIYTQRFVLPILLAVINCHRFCRAHLRQQLTILKIRKENL